MSYPSTNNPTPGSQARIDRLMQRRLPSWRTAIRAVYFRRAWCKPGCYFLLNNSAALNALRELRKIPE